MNLFEWLGESFNPGPVGGITATREPLFDRSIKKGWAIFFMIIGAGILGLFIWMILTSQNKLLYLGLLILYLLVCYFLTPKPDGSNIGWLGGLINNPFRISDNINRFLLIFYLFLLPGKLMVFAIQTFYRLINYNLR
jgi:hypothetical protein